LRGLGKLSRQPADRPADAARSSSGAVAQIKERSSSDLASPAEACFAKAGAVARKKEAPSPARAPHLQLDSGLCRHGAIAATYLALAYAAKLVFGISIAFNAMR